MRLILRSVTFEGFQSPNRRASIQLSGAQASIIYGTNGCGKTTFLKLLHATLSKNGNELIKNHVFRVFIEFVDDSDVAHSVKIERLIPDPNAAEFVEGYDWTELEASALNNSTSLSLGVERGVSTQTLSIEGFDIARFFANNPEGINLPRSTISEISERLAFHLNRQSIIRNRQHTLRSRGRSNELQLEQEHSLLQNIKTSNIEGLLVERYRIARNYASEKIQNALFDTLALAIDSNPKNSANLNIPLDLDAQIIAGKERIMEALADGPENKFKDRVVGILDGIKSIGDVSTITSNSILCQLIWNMIKELKLEKQLLNSINVFTETFDEFLGEGKRLSITPEGVHVIIRGKSFGIDVLSSGERHLFTFLALVIIVARDRDFLIIDEPEISLNPAWQRDLISLLQELAPDTQLIVASHSPMIARGRPDILVELNPVEQVFAGF